jgi:hypothetical protein
MEDLLMKAASVWLSGASLALFVFGCAGGTKDKERSPETRAQSDQPEDRAEQEAKVRVALAKLDPADHKLAQAQQFCAVMSKHRLGSMGTPVKVMVQDQPVFLCCDNCEEKALKHPEQTLAKVRELKAKGDAEPH